MRPFALAIMTAIAVGAGGPAQEKKKVTVVPEEIARGCVVTFAEGVNSLDFDNAVKWAAFPLESRQIVGGKFQPVTYATADDLKKALKAAGEKSRFKLGTRNGEIPFTPWDQARGGFDPKTRARIDGAASKGGLVVRFGGDKLHKPVEAVVVPVAGPMWAKIVYLSWVGEPSA